MDCSPLTPIVPLRPPARAGKQIGHWLSGPQHIGTISQRMYYLHKMDRISAFGLRLSLFRLQTGLPGREQCSSPDVDCLKPISADALAPALHGAATT